MTCDPPQKNNAFYVCSMLAASPDTCHASKKKASIKAKALTKIPSTIAEIASVGSLFQPLALGRLKKHQKSLLEPFRGGSRGLLGTSWRGQDGPKRRQDSPKSRQDRPKSSPGAPPERSWQPSGAQLPPKSSLEVSRTPFWPPRGSMFNPPGADCGGLGCFFCRQPLATKRLANKGWSAVLAEP